MNKLLKCILLLSGLLGVMPQAFAAPTVDTANVTSSTNFVTNAVTQTVTVGGSDNLLLVGECTFFNSGTGHAPDTVTYNGTSLTQEGSTYVVATNNDCSLWYLSSPPTGSYSLVATWTTNTNVRITAVMAIPISGAATSAIFGTNATNTSSSDNNPTVTVTGGSAGTLYIAEAINWIQTTTTSGTGQTSLVAQQSLDSSTNKSIVLDSMPGTGSGNFAWTGSGTVLSTLWGALGVNINGAAGGSCTHAGITSAGAIAIPNGTSGLYQLKNGSLGTPDCSTVEYKCPTLGNFCTN